MKQLFIVILLLICGCTVNIYNPQRITIKGSDTMLLLTQKLAAEYMKRNTDISIYVEGGGTSTGMKSLIEGKADICMASRTLNPRELKELAEQYKTIGFQTIIAKDALSIYVNNSNKIRNFTLKELKSIFTGQITNWIELKGENLPIGIVIRNSGSGTHLYFKEHVLGGEEYSKTAIIANTTNEVISNIISNKSFIGYGGVAFNNGIFHASVEEVFPSEENILKDIYPLTRYLYYITMQKPEGKTKRFINWVMSSDGQEIIKKEGYFAVWKTPLKN